MKLSQLIDIAKHSALNTLAVKNDTEAVISFVNLGLLNLYTVFNLQTEEYLIELEDGVSIYDLPSDFMHLTGAFEAPPEGSSENMRPLPINEEGNPFSINTINFKQVQVPLNTTGAYISLIYAVKPNYLTVDDLDEEIPLPDHLLEPLLNFIAMQGHGAIRNEAQGESDIYGLRYRRSCDAIKTQGVAIASDDLSMDSRIGTRGFP